MPVEPVLAFEVHCLVLCGPTGLFNATSSNHALQSHACLSKHMLQAFSKDAGELGPFLSEL